MCIFFFWVCLTLPSDLSLSDFSLWSLSLWSLSLWSLCVCYVQVDALVNSSRDETPPHIRSLFAGKASVVPTLRSGEYDFVVSALPLNKHTTNFWTTTEIKEMGKQCVFVNVGRGKSVRLGHKRESRDQREIRERDQREIREKSERDQRRDQRETIECVFSFMFSLSTHFKKNVENPISSEPWTKDCFVAQHWMVSVIISHESSPPASSWTIIISHESSSTSSVMNHHQHHQSWIISHESSSTSVMNHQSWIIIITLHSYTILDDNSWSLFVFFLFLNGYQCLRLSLCLRALLCGEWTMCWCLLMPVSTLPTSGRMQYRCSRLTGEHTRHSKHYPTDSIWKCCWSEWSEDIFRL